MTFWGNTRWSNPRLDQKVYIYLAKEVLEAKYLGHGNYRVEKWNAGVPFSGRWMPREIPAPPVE